MLAKLLTLKGLLLGGGSLALVGTIITLGTSYYHTLDVISETDGEVVPAQAPIPAIPSEHQQQAQQIIDGYQQHYIEPIDALGDQAADPTAPDPVMPDEIPTLPAPG